MFTRGGDDLKNSAVFIGGADVAKGEALLKEACGAFFGPVRVSVMLDANGCNTTATAAVVKLLSAGDLRGKKTVVLAGTGPVGRRAAGLLAEGRGGRGRGRDPAHGDDGAGEGRLRHHRRALRGAGDPRRRRRRSRHRARARGGGGGPVHRRRRAPAGL